MAGLKWRISNTQISASSTLPFGAEWRRIRAGSEPESPVPCTANSGPAADTKKAHALRHALFEAM
jgi:hypothetical protein